MASLLQNLYGLWFTEFDPMFYFISACVDFLTPQKALLSVNPLKPHDPDYDPIIFCRGGAMLSIFFLISNLLRYSTDREVWKCVQASLLIMDLALLYAGWEALSLKGKLRVSSWTDWDMVRVWFPVVTGVVRMAFLAGLGMGTRRTEGKGE